MAAVTIRTDFGAQENKSVTVSTFHLSIFHAPTFKSDKQIIVKYTLYQQDKYMMNQIKLAWIY